MKSTDISNTDFQFKQAEPVSNRVRMELDGNGMATSAWLSFSEQGSIEQQTAGDAWQLTPLSQEYTLLATEKPGVGLMDIGHFALSEDLSIPLTAEATQPGSYTLHVTDFEVPGDPALPDRPAHRGKHPSGERGPL